MPDYSLEQPGKINLKKSLVTGKSGGSDQKSQEPLEITGKGEVLGLGLTEVYDKDGNIVKNTLHLGSLPVHVRKPVSQQPPN
jgi:hypothetical protein